MNVLYAPPSNDEKECLYLEENWLTCLKEKSVRDDVPRMQCKPEYLMWFVLECPDKVNGYHKDDYLKRIFKMVKLNPDSPNPTAKPQRVDINID
mmetsp:Transcript_7476/g.6804  ORF Transcript_7476/g.6804 Transcript_7476/m.6804 type:complete len:94 (+) Transcript_7476:64-345(+)